MPLIFTLLATNIPHFLTAAILKIWMLFLQRNSSPFFFISRSSSFSVIYVSVEIKFNQKKNIGIVVVFSLLKSEWPCDLPPKRTGAWMRKCRLSFMGGRTDGRMLTWLPKFPSSTRYIFSFPWCSPARVSRARELYYNVKECERTEVRKEDFIWMISMIVLSPKLRF